MRTMGLLCAVALWAVADDGEVARLIQRLGAPAWAEREAASRALAERGAAVVPALEQLARSEDLERSARARAILAQIARAERERQRAAVEAERRANLDAYRTQRAALLARHPGRWVAFAGGELGGIEDSLDVLVDEIAHATRAARHRLLYRVGADRDEPPRGHGSLRHGDLGAAFGELVDFGVGSDGEMFRIARGAWLPLEGLHLRIPGAALELRTLFGNTGLPEAVCVEPSAAEALTLERYELPGEVRGSTLSPEGRPGTILDYPARRAWVRLAGAGMGEPSWVQALVPTARR